jgi:hypothetical protein
MSDQDDIRRIALSLPGAIQDGLGYRVNGEQFAWAYPEKVHPKKPRVPNPEVLCVRVADQDEKRMLLNADPTKLFTTDHYNGYPAVMVRLSRIDPDQLAALITDAWRTRFPNDLLKEFKARFGE